MVRRRSYPTVVYGQHGYTLDVLLRNVLIEQIHEPAISQQLVVLLFYIYRVCLVTDKADLMYYSTRDNINRADLFEVLGHLYPMTLVPALFIEVYVLLIAIENYLVAPLLFCIVCQSLDDTEPDTGIPMMLIDDDILDVTN
jgi:hypothetical protein